MRLRLAAALVALVLCWGSAVAQPRRPAKPDVVYIPTPPDVVEAMLLLANVNGTDVVYDLGSGDGRIVITAAKKYGVRGVGIELDPAMVKQARQNAAAAGVEGRVKFLTQDLFTADFKPAIVVTPYLLQPQRGAQTEAGSRVAAGHAPGVSRVQHGARMAGAQTVTAERSRIFLWSIMPR